MHMETLPEDFKKALRAHPKAQAAWNGLTPIAHRDFVSWIESAKKPETRTRRVDKAWSMLEAGKRRPCCYAVVPLSLYAALAAHPRAKERWGALTPDQRRDFVGWVNAAQEPAAHAERIARACSMLASGRKKP